ncbi:MAG: hypothetical protein IPF96_20725 [Rhodobacter sp.]|nr:hypothetical protein [Rhodobacter sp.]
MQMPRPVLQRSRYAYNAMRDPIGAARAYYIESDSAVAEVERILAFDEEEVGEVTVDTAETRSGITEKLGCHRRSRLR